MAKFVKTNILTCVRGRLVGWQSPSGLLARGLGLVQQRVTSSAYQQICFRHLFSKKDRHSTKMRSLFEQSFEEHPNVALWTCHALWPSLVPSHSHPRAASLTGRCTLGRQNALRDFQEVPNNLPVVGHLFNRCPIPTIFLWTYAMTVLCVVLLCAHAWLSLATLRGGRIVRNKANEVSQRITQAKNDLGKGVDEVSLSEFRDVFVSQVVLLQQTLLVEQKVRGSRWNTVVGAGSLLWIVVVIWNLILVVGWTFVPGIISFHPAGEIGTPESYCGAWARVVMHICRKDVKTCVHIIVDSFV